MKVIKDEVKEESDREGDEGISERKREKRAE